MIYARSIAAALLAAPVSARLISETADAGWKHVSRVSSGEMVKGFVAIHEANVHAAEDLLLDISNPASAKFGQYLDFASLIELLQPAKESFEEVKTWLRTAGIASNNIRIKHASSVIDFTATAEQFESLMGAECHQYKHPDIEGDHVQCHDAAVPAHMKKHVEFVHPGGDLLKRAEKVPGLSLPYKTELAAVPTSTGEQGSLSRCATSWTPECINQLYSIGPAGKAAPGNSLGIYGYADIYNQSDLDMFFKQYAQSIPKGTKPIYKGINGGKDITRQRYSIGEENLDLQMAYPIVYPQEITLWQVDDAGGLQHEGFGNHFLDAVDKSYCTFDGGDDAKFDEILPDFSHNYTAECGTYKSTNVVSISYGVDSTPLSQHYQDRQCREWMKLALTGVTVLVAAGDRGTASSSSCAVNPLNKTLEAFASNFPATCAYVTTVGATQVNFTSNGDYKEVAVDDAAHQFWSGGGFSATQPRPKWQDEAVAAYLKDNDPKYPAGTFNASGRGYPDVTALGALVAIADQGKFTVSGGTSSATPLFAAIINKINDVRILAGKKPIGFLNQILYTHPEVLNDITEGRNPGCKTDGFKAAKGWDPVSGLGSPNYPKLASLLTGLP